MVNLLFLTNHSRPFARSGTCHPDASNNFVYSELLWSISPSSHITTPFACSGTFHPDAPYNFVSSELLWSISPSSQTNHALSQAQGRATQMPTTLCPLRFCGQSPLPHKPLTPFASSGTCHSDASYNFVSSELLWSISSSSQTTHALRKLRDVPTRCSLQLCVL